MQQDESEVPDRELIDAVESYERRAALVEGQENDCDNTSPVADVELLAATTWLENYLQQRDVTITGECPSVCPSVMSDHCICTPQRNVTKTHIIYLYHNSFTAIDAMHKSEVLMSCCVRPSVRPSVCRDVELST